MAEMKGYTFTGAKMTGTNFSVALFDANTKVFRCQTDAGTKFPPGFKVG